MHYEDLQSLNIDTRNADNFDKDKEACDDYNKGTDDSMSITSWIEILHCIWLLFGRLSTNAAILQENIQSLRHKGSTNAVYQITVSNAHELRQLLRKYIKHLRLSDNDGSLHYSLFVDLPTNNVELADRLTILCKPYAASKNLEALNLNVCLEQHWCELGMITSDTRKRKPILLINMRNSKNTMFRIIHNTELKKLPGFCVTENEPRSYKKILGEKPAYPTNPEASDKNYRISTLCSIRILNCSVDDVASAGFYIDENGFVCCFRCIMKFNVQDFWPQDPFHRRWHGSPCTNSSYEESQKKHGRDPCGIRDVKRQCKVTIYDGMICDSNSEPQTTIYIPPGDVRSEQYRLSTFQHYPMSVHVSKIDLAAAGFYFTGYSDRVKCFSCGRVVENWEPGDNPADPTWHKSNCNTEMGFHSKNIPMTFRLASAKIRNMLNSLSRQQTNLHEGHMKDTSVQSKPPTHQKYHGDLSKLQIPAQWKLAEVMSSEHRRFLSNLFLNRELDRLSSFAQWPTQSPNVSPSALAKTGFFYLGNLDRTQCFSCGGVLWNWTVNDNALLEHRNHFPDCLMVLGTETCNVPIPEQPETREEREGAFTCRYPSNPHMRRETTRLDTFDRRWSVEKTAATPDEIAQAGFFLGECDHVKCWYCNGGLQNWDYDAVPWVEHAKWFPNCQFLLRAKGQHFVHRHLSAHPHLQRPIIAKQEGASFDLPDSGPALSTRQQNPSPSETAQSSRQPTPTPTIIVPKDEQRNKKQHIQDVMKNSDIVKNIILMGFDAKIIEGLIEAKLTSGTHANDEDIYESVLELLNDVLERERQIKEESALVQILPGTSNATVPLGAMGSSMDVKCNASTQEEQTRKNDFDQSLMKISSILNCFVSTNFDPEIEEQRRRKEYIQNLMKISALLPVFVAAGFEPKIVEEVLQDKLLSGIQINEQYIKNSYATLWNDIMERERQIIEETTASLAGHDVPSSSFMETEGGSADENDDASSRGGPCKICYSEHSAMVVFVPCGHLCCCIECAKEFQECPICRKRIERAVKVYRP